MAKKRRRSKIDIANQYMGKLQSIPLYKLFPSMITVFALCLGITAIRYSLDGKFHMAAALIVIAAFMDSLDGRIARLLNVTSEFGAQLDSLADLVSFGVAPAITIYLWNLHTIEFQGVGWAIVLFYVVCSALRLARFNVQSDDDHEAHKMKTFFTGVPIPAAGILVLTPMITSFELLNSYKFSHLQISLVLIIVGFLMISRLPTFSAKQLNIKTHYVRILIVSIVLVFAGIMLEPWIVLPFLAAIYFLSIPCSLMYYYLVYLKNK